MKAIANHFDPAGAPYARLADWLRTNTLLERLRAAQMLNDPSGPLKACEFDPKFQLAMTLRDCTVFVRIPADPGRPVEAKLGDMDQKNWEDKLGYWQSMESRLVEEGYYAGKEEPRQVTDCQLQRRTG
jgi:inositol-pentakisphosphate 2-kinase